MSEWDPTAMEPIVRATLGKTSRLHRPLDEITLDDDLYRCGLTSHDSVKLMLALERAFDVEFPEHLLRKSTFESLAGLMGALMELRPAVA